jgi:hypothetical protein
MTNNGQQRASRGLVPMQIEYSRPLTFYAHHVIMADGKTEGVRMNTLENGAWINVKPGDEKRAMFALALHACCDMDIFEALAEWERRI